MSAEAVEEYLTATETNLLETGECEAAKDSERPGAVTESSPWERPYRELRLADGGRYHLTAGQPMCIAGTTVGPLYTAGCARADPLDKLVYAGAGLRGRLRLHKQRPARLLREWLAREPWWRDEWRWVFCGWEHCMEAVREGRLLPLMREMAVDRRLLPAVGWPADDPPPPLTFLHAWAFLVRWWVAYFCVMPRVRACSPIGYTLQVWVDTMLDLGHALTRGERRFTNDTDLVTHPRYPTWRPRRERVVLAGGLPNLVGQSAPWGVWINTPNLTLEPHVMMARIVEKLLDHRCAFRNISEIVEGMNASNETIAYFLMDVLMVGLMGMYPHCSTRPSWRVRMWLRSQFVLAAGLPHTQFLVWVYACERLVLYALKEFYMWMKGKDVALSSALARMTYTPHAHTFVIGLMDQVRGWYDTLPVEVLWADVQTAGLKKTLADLELRMTEEAERGVVDGVRRPSRRSGRAPPAWRVALDLGPQAMQAEAFEYYRQVRDAMLAWQAKLNSTVLGHHKDNFNCQWKRHESPDAASFFGFHMASWLKDYEQSAHRAKLREVMHDMPARCRFLLAALRRREPQAEGEEAESEEAQAAGRKKREAALNRLTHWVEVMDRLHELAAEVTADMNPDSKECKDILKSVEKYENNALDALINGIVALREETQRMRRTYGPTLRGAPPPKPRFKKRQVFRWAKPMAEAVEREWFPQPVPAPQEASSSAAATPPPQEPPRDSTVPPAPPAPPPIVLEPREPLPVTIEDMMSAEHVRRVVYVKAKNSFVPDPMLTPDEAWIVEQAAKVAIERVLCPDPIIPLRWLRGLGLTAKGYELFVNVYVNYLVLDESDNSMLAGFAELFAHNEHDYALIQRYMTSLRWLIITQMWALPKHVHERQLDALYRARGLLPYQPRPEWLGGLRMCRCGAVLERVNCLDETEYTTQPPPRFNSVRNGVQCMAGHHVCQLEPLLLQLCGRVLRSGSRLISICVLCGEFVECGNSTWTGDGPVCPAHVIQATPPVKRPELPPELAVLPSVRAWMREREDRAVMTGACHTARCIVCRKLRPVVGGWTDMVFDETTCQLVCVFICSDDAEFSTWSLKRSGQRTLFMHEVRAAVQRGERYATYRMLKKEGMGRLALAGLRKANLMAQAEAGLDKRGHDDAYFAVISQE